MDLGISRRKALIVGGSRGLGREIAVRLAAEGATVAIIGRDADSLASTVELMGGKALGHVALIGDAMEDGAPSYLVRKLNELSFVPDILVHNLGGSYGISDGLSSLDKWKLIFRSNLEVAIEFNAMLVPRMQAARWGRVVHVSSVAAISRHGSVPYATAKAAVNVYASRLGGQVAADGVIVTAVMPGAILSGHWAKVAATDPSRAATYLERHLATKRFATPQEIADVIVFLCSERASFCAGATFPVDGYTF